MKKIGQILKWIPPAFFALLILAGGASAIFFLLATILTLPIPKLQQFKKEKLKIGTGLTVLLSVILLVVGIMVSPTPPQDNDDEPSRSSISETDSSSTESSVTSSTEEKETATTTTSTEEEKTTTTTTPAITTTVETTTTTVTTPEPTIPEDSSFSVTYLDVGQADAALVECDGHYMLIDGGNKGDSSIMYTVLKNAGITHLDIVVGTHAHEDHIGGLPGAFNYATADMTLCPVTSGDSDAFNDFKKYADSKGGGITVPSVGDQYELGSADIEILGVNAESDANNTSIVLMITYGETRFLFTGDAEREAEQAILNRGVDLSATVLKTGHHGSDTSTSYVWLNAIMPQYAVISVGEGNSYGHPTDAVLSRFRDADVTVYRTDLNGDVVAVSDGKTVTITAEKSASNEDIMTPGGTVQEPVVTTPPDDDNSEPDAGVDYVLNTNSKKFHYPSCSSVDDMKESNKQYYTGSRDDLIASGYSPCGRCHP